MDDNTIVSTLAVKYLSDIPAGVRADSAAMASGVASTVAGNRELANSSVQVKAAMAGESDALLVAADGTTILSRGSLTATEANRALAASSLESTKSLATQGAAAELSGHKTETALRTIGRAGTIATVGIAAVGYETLKMSSNFERQMEMVHTQAGASQVEVDKLTNRLIALSGSVATGPEALALSLYHVESAGFRGAKALDIVHAAAMGAKIGNADLEAVTQAMIAAEASHIKGITSETDAMAQLNAIVGSGDMKMEGLAQAMSTGLLPVAAIAGLSLRDVGAALATVTDNATPPVEAATRLRMTLALISAPAGAAAKALEAVGISASEANRELAHRDELAKYGIHLSDLAADLRKPNGLLVAVMDLKKHLEDAGLSATEQSAVISRAFGGGRSSAVIETLIGQSDRLKSKYAEQATQATKFNDDWNKTTETTAFKAAQAKANVDALMIAVGDDLVPVFDELVQAVSPAAKSLADFASHNKELVAIALGVGGALATTAALIGLVMRLKVAYDAVKIAAIAAKDAEITAALAPAGLAALGPAAVAVAGGAYITQVQGENQKRTQSTFDKETTAYEAGSISTDQYTKDKEAFLQQGHGNDYVALVKKITDAETEGTKAGHLHAESIKRIAQAHADAAEWAKQYEVDLHSGINATQQHTTATDKEGTSIAQVAGRYREARLALQELNREKLIKADSTDVQDVVSRFQASRYQPRAPLGGEAGGRDHGPVAVTNAEQQQIDTRLLEEARHQGVLTGQNISMTAAHLQVATDTNKILQDTYQLDLDRDKQKAVDSSSKSTAGQKADAANTVQHDLNVRLEDQDKLAQDRTLQNVADRAAVFQSIGTTASAHLEEARHQGALLSQSLGMSDQQRAVALDQNKILQDTYQLDLDMAKYDIVKGDPKSTKDDKAQALLPVQHDVNVRIEDQGQLAKDQHLLEIANKFDPLLAKDDVQISHLDRQIALLQANTTLSAEQKAIQLATLQLQRDLAQLARDNNQLLEDRASGASKSTIANDQKAIFGDNTTIMVDRANISTAQNPTWSQQIQNANDNLAKATDDVAQKEYDLSRGHKDNLGSLDSLKRKQDEAQATVKRLSDSAASASARLDTSFSGVQTQAQKQLAQATDDLERKERDLANGVKDNLPPLAVLQGRAQDAADKVAYLGSIAQGTADYLAGIPSGGTQRVGGMTLPTVFSMGQQVADSVPDWLKPYSKATSLNNQPPQEAQIGKDEGLLEELRHQSVLIGQNNTLTAEQKKLQLDQNKISQDLLDLDIAKQKRDEVYNDPNSTKAQKAAADAGVTHAYNIYIEDKGTQNNDLGMAAIAAKFDPLIAAGNAQVAGIDRSISIEQADSTINADQKAIDIANLELQRAQTQLSIDTNKWLELIAENATPEQIAAALKTIGDDKAGVAVALENVDSATNKKTLDDLKELDAQQIAGIDRSNIILSHMETMIDLQPGLSQGQKDLQKSQLAAQIDGNKTAIDNLRLTELLADPNTPLSQIEQQQNQILSDTLQQDTDAAEQLKAIREIAVEQLQIQEIGLDFQKAGVEHAKAMIDLDPNLSTSQKDAQKAALSVQEDQLALQQDNLRIQEVIAGGGTQADYLHALLQQTQDGYKLQEDQYSEQIKLRQAVDAGNTVADLQAFIKVLQGLLASKNSPVSRGNLGPASTLNNGFGSTGSQLAANRGR